MLASQILWGGGGGGGEARSPPPRSTYTHERNDSVLYSLYSPVFDAYKPFPLLAVPCRRFSPEKEPAIDIPRQPLVFPELAVAPLLEVARAAPN